MCPHSVAQLSVRSSRQSVHVLPARRRGGIDATSKTVFLSSSAGFTSDSEAETPSKVETGRSSMNISFAESSEHFPIDLSKEACVLLRKNVMRRWRRRIAMSMPSNEYDGGRI